MPHEERGMKFHWVHWTIALGFVFFLSCEKASKPLDPVPPDDGEDPVLRKIAFVSDRDTYPLRQIYTMTCDGNRQVRLTDTTEDFINPVFSPDGKHILATSYVYNDFDEIWLMDVDGGNLRNLSQSPGDDNFASFSPDGSRILFASRRDGNSGIYMMDTDGNNLARLTQREAIDHSPQFTADGSRILYCSTRVNPDGDDWPYDIIIMNSDGSGKTCLTEGRSYCFYRYALGGSPQGKEVTVRYNIKPNLSTDGARIVFTSYDPISESIQVWMMNADGTNHRLVYGGDWVIHPVLFAPGDQRIVFMSHRANKTDIYDMDLDGFDQVKLSEGVPGHMVFSEFSPDGSQILFYTEVPTGNYRFAKIWVMKPDGSGQTQLTFGEGNDSYPHFQPVIPDSL
jgi:Tol biopolymer transport system component